MNIPIRYWQSTEGQYSENTFDKPLYSSEPNTAPENTDYFTIKKEFEDAKGQVHSLEEDQVSKIADYLEFRGQVRESRSGESWRVYKNQLNNSFDLSAIGIK